ncbi:hypothetical protein [Streptomyces sp. ST1015]|uniref:hypothetical protein n=1 Tax=Streptomyces sp. ST1015 TaxID=1848900 RepID=UPI000DD6D98C|nr:MULTISPECIES: hypothetical protein [unclassified Streptomyces]QZZ29055.1 hypothetical protein A7X85_24885 [Streptomyces sp. ST1015]
MSVSVLPESVTGLFDPRYSLLRLVPRKHEEWADDLVALMRGARSETGFGVDPAVMFDELSGAEVRESLLPVTRESAQDLLKIIAAGSLHDGVDAAALRHPDEIRDGCIREMLDSMGDSVEFFTNHGCAEEGPDADFLVSGFHWESFAVTLYDIGLVAVSPDRLLVAWRFEDA